MDDFKTYGGKESLSAGQKTLRRFTISEARNGGWFVCEDGRLGYAGDMLAAYGTTEQMLAGLAEILKD